jgi:hypothetical protein
MKSRDSKPPSFFGLGPIFLTEKNTFGRPSKKAAARAAFFLFFVSKGINHWQRYRRPSGPLNVVPGVQVRLLWAAVSQTDVIGHSSFGELGQIPYGHEPPTHEIKQIAVSLAGTPRGELYPRPCS